MALKKAEKQSVIEKLSDIFEKTKSVVFINFKGLTVSNTMKVRRKLQEDGVTMLVAKKTLMRKALEGKKVSGELADLPGEIAVAYLKEGSDDITAPARGIYSFAKELKDSLSIVGGIFEGAFKSKEAMMEIATIPSQKALYAMVANVLQSPLQKLAIAMSEIAKKKEVTPQA